LGDEILDCASDVLDRDSGIDTVLVQEIDAIRLEPLQHSLNGQSDVLRPAVESPIMRPVSGSMFQPNFEEITT